MGGGKRAALTLVELLVVIAIIGLLAGLLLPAVQSVRESGRRTHCANNVAQLAKAALVHETTHGFYPSGGWGDQWVGDADRGFGKRQPGGFIYSLLPYLEQQGAWALPTDSDPNSMQTAQLNGGRTLARTILPALNCPTRRPGQLYPKPGNGLVIANNAAANASSDNTVARGDYACNGGDQNGDASTGINVSGPPATIALATFSGTQSATMTGLAGQFSEVRASDIVDGASLIYLIGERVIDSRNYLTGAANHDDGNWAQGSSNDTVRTAAVNPVQDKADSAPGDSLAFGGPHAMAFGMAFADGAVKWIRYDIDPALHKALARRSKDGVVIRGDAIR